MSQDDKILLRSLKEEDLPVLGQLANNKKIWLNVRDMLPHPYTLDDAIFFFNLIKSLWLNDESKLSSEVEDQLSIYL